MTEYDNARLRKAVENAEYWYRETCQLREEVERIREERNEAQRLLSQSEGHALLLQDSVNQQRERLAALGAALTRKNRIEGANYRDPYEAGGDMPRTTIGAEIRQQMHDDQAEPCLAAALAAIDTDTT